MKLEDIEHFIHKDDRLKKRIEKGLNWKVIDINNALIAYREFLELKVALSDWDGKILLAPDKIKKKMKFEDIEHFIHKDDRLKKRIEKSLNWKEIDINNALIAYREFLELKVALNDWDGKILLAPDKIKKVWELHILDTTKYSDECETLFGNIIHYSPDGEKNASIHTEKVMKTKLAYQARFGKEPSSKEWGFQEVKVSKKRSSAKSISDFQVRIRQLTGEITSISMDPSDTVDFLKIKYQDEEGFPPNEQRFIFKGQQLADGSSLGFYGIKHNDVIDFVARLRGC